LVLAIGNTYHEHDQYDKEYNMFQNQHLCMVVEGDTLQIQGEHSESDYKEYTMMNLWNIVSNALKNVRMKKSL
jgi:hypothetical protein